jgi:hypothetical protein
VTEQSQHIQALARANEVRLGIAAAKRRIAKGELLPSEFLDEPVLQPARVMDVLTAQRRWGRTRARKFLGSVGGLMRSIEGVRIADLTARERSALQTALTDLAGRLPSNGNQPEGGSLDG